MSRTLIVGLGNPGSQYAKTRHNIGFMALDRLASRYGMSASSNKFKGLWCNGSIGTHSVTLLKPQTFMNLSGDSVQKAAAFFDIEADSIIVLHDELDIGFGELRVKSGGGHGGHNGLRDIIAKTGSKDFTRVRIGIGRPTRGSVSDWVLGGFSGTEQSSLEELIETAADAVEAIVYDGVIMAQNKFNGA